MLNRVPEVSSDGAITVPFIRTAGLKHGRDDVSRVTAEVLLATLCEGPIVTQLAV